jgi:gamma-glutamyltranspeptidase/glutathione hydrolase
MPLIKSSFSAPCRPVLRGRFGAVSAAHPLAVAAGQELLNGGGSAADAAIAAQAVLCVVMPDACSLGGDMLALVRGADHDMQADDNVRALNGTGRAPLRLDHVADDGANSITVPGIVDAWCRLSQDFGQVALAHALAPAIRLARAGVRTSDMLAATLAKHRERLVRGGAHGWAFFDASPHSLIRQPELAAVLQAVGAAGRSAFYGGSAARQIAAVVEALGGALDERDLEAHETVLARPIETAWDDMVVSTQPPMAQGILLNLSVQALGRLGRFAPSLADHVAIELTNAAFAHRDDVAEGLALLDRPLAIDLERAANRSGPRAYLHTAGVACADAQGMVISSLVSVFDDFGSCVFVPALGITLNNRAGGFTGGANAAAPGKLPVHTLAPALLTMPEGTVALATPGADGQVQTLLQVLMGLRCAGLDLAAAIARPRWRSENGMLLIEEGHAGREALAALGHRIVSCPDGDARFGAVVSAGCLHGEPVGAADWRRDTSVGVV